MSKKQNKKSRDMAEILLSRLEKISTDSSWAHQASGVRAAIAKILSREEIPFTDLSKENLEKLMTLGFKILENAAGEIPEEHRP